MLLALAAADSVGVAEAAIETTVLIAVPGAQAPSFVQSPLTAVNGKTECEFQNVIEQKRILLGVSPSVQ